MSTKRRVRIKVSCATIFLLVLAVSAAQAQVVKGSGTAGTIPVWTNGAMVGNSVLKQTGGNVTNAGGNVTAQQLVSTVGTGTPPLIVASTTQVPKLNASSVGGFGPGAFIQNTASPQTGNFNLSGNGTLGGALSAGSVNSTGAYQIGGATVLSVDVPNFGVFVGNGAGFTNITGARNTAVGFQAFETNTDGSDNTAIGYDALNNNTFTPGSGGGYNNTAIGSGALSSNTTGLGNTATGAGALQSNNTGYENVAIGDQALIGNTTGASNVVIGGIALESSNGSRNTVVGRAAGQYLKTGNLNTLLGFLAGFNFGTSESNNIDIGNAGLAGDGAPGPNNGVIRIGTDGSQDSSCSAGCQTATFIAAIHGVTTGSSTTSAVLVDTNGQLGTIASSRRYKEDIQDMGAASDGLLHLRPVTFRYKKAFDDGSKPIQYGLVAEEVAEVYPDLVVRGKDGQVETVQYYKLDAMLLNEIQKLAKAHAADQAEIAELKSQLADQLKQGQEQQAAMRQLLDQVRVIQATLAATSAPKATTLEVAAKY